MNYISIKLSLTKGSFIRGIREGGGEGEEGEGEEGGKKGIQKKTKEKR